MQAATRVSTALLAGMLPNCKPIIARAAAKETKQNVYYFCTANNLTLNIKQANTA
jgi:hypothetical protein